jgi:hypothetical protein
MDGCIGEAPSSQVARHVGFCDVSASNFLYSYILPRPHIEDVQNVETTVSKGRITKQGVRDLNNYGPRPDKGAAGAPVGASNNAEGAKPASSGDAGKTGDTGETSAAAEAQ